MQSHISVKPKRLRKLLFVEYRCPHLHTQELRSLDSFNYHIITVHMCIFVHSPPTIMDGANYNVDARSVTSRFKVNCPMYNVPIDIIDA